MKYFIDCDIDYIISSPIGRAKKTAQILCDEIGKNYDFIEYDDSFKEIDLGNWTKKKIDDLPYDDKKSSYKCYKKTPQLFKPNDGENLFELQDRIVKGYNKIITKYKNANNIIIVSHSVAIRTILLYIENKKMDFLWSYELPPASKTLIVYNSENSYISKIGF